MSCPSHPSSKSSKKGIILLHQTGLGPGICHLSSPRHLAYDSVIKKGNCEHVLEFQLTSKIPLPPTQIPSPGVTRPPLSTTKDSLFIPGSDSIIFKAGSHSRDKLMGKWWGETAESQPTRVLGALNIPVHMHITHLCFQPVKGDTPLPNIPCWGVVGGWGLIENGGRQQAVRGILYKGTGRGTKSQSTYSVSGVQEYISFNSHSKTAWWI